MELQKAACRRPTARVLHERCVSRHARSSVFRPCCQKYGKELRTQLWVVALPPLLLVFWPFTHLYLFSPLPLFLSCLSCVLLGVFGPAAILVCLSGMNGSTLWSSPLPEEARDITCLNLMPGGVAETICLVTGTHKMLSAFNATSGKDRFPQKSSAPGSRNLGLEQSSGGGGFLASHGGKIWFTTRGGSLGRYRRGWSGLNTNLWFNLFDDRKGAKLSYLNRNYPETFAL